MYQREIAIGIARWNTYIFLELNKYLDLIFGSCMIIPPIQLKIITFNFMLSFSEPKSLFTYKLLTVNAKYRLHVRA